MTPSPLGRLQRVDLRAAWKNESSHFTPWLAQAENIALLGETIGTELEVQGQEQAVGPFRADILCRDTSDSSLVLIENQLERTDHGHLGQLLTYAAGLKAVTVVWIAERFTEEHRAALDWLNRITDDSFHAFGLEIELWRIGDSPFAPKFNVVVKPNEWARGVQEASKGSSGATRVGQMQVRYWTAFGEFLTKKKGPFKPPKPSASNWIPYGLGRSGTALLAFVNAGHISVGVDINQREHPTWFAKLDAQRAEIEAATGFAMEWEAKPDAKFARLRAWLELDMYDEANWPKSHAWLFERLLALREAFRPRILALDDGPEEGAT